MIKQSQSGAITVTGKHIDVFCMLAAKSAIKLESFGMKHSSGRSMRKAWAIKLGMKPNAKCDAVIAELQKRIEATV